MSSTENAKPTTAKHAARKYAGPDKHQEPALRCPRCDSPNTKFCYYNNYSLSQPRHFCKTCRRYWTKGGALRSVPIGGGCRKNRKMKCSPRDSSGGGSGSLDVGGLRFFQGISPAMDFQLNFPRLPSPPPNPGIFGHFSTLGDNIQNIANSSSTPGFSLDPTIGFPFSSSGLKQMEPNNAAAGFQEMGSVNFHRNFASSIESLSSINQDLHWKLQQQRLAMFVSEDKEKENSNFSLPSIEPVPVIQKPQPILFQNLEVSNSKQESFPRKDGGTGGSLSTEWFFDNFLATSSRNGNENINNWSEIQAWSNFP